MKDSYLKLLSAVFSEVSLAFYLILIFSFYGNIGGMGALDNILIGSLFMLILPVSAVAVSYRKVVLEMGSIAKGKRTKFYLFNLLCYAIVSFVFNYFGNLTMLEISLSYFFSMLILFFINFKSKISLHAAGVSITSMVLILNFKLIGVISLVLVPFVWWLRLKLKAHNIEQLLWGSFVGFVVTDIVFLVFM